MAAARSPVSLSRESSGLSTASSTSDYASLVSQIQYSGRHDDIEYQYRHVILPSELAKYLPKNRVALVEEWRSLGICMSPGWENYELVPQRMRNKHIMVFRRPLSFGQMYPVKKKVSIPAAPTPTNTVETPSKVSAGTDEHDTTPTPAPVLLADPEKNSDKAAVE